MKKINAVIVDDEAGNRENLENIIKNYCKNVEVVGEADSAISGIQTIKEKKPDLVFLDIEMPNGNGFDLLENYGEIDFEVIFVTAYDQYAIKAIKFSAADYLLKPINILELNASIDKIRKRLSAKQQNQKINQLLENISTNQISEKKIALPTSDKLIFVPISEIIRCEGQNNYTSFILKSEKNVLVSKTLKEFDELLSDFGFLRVHQSHLINLRYVKTYVRSDGGYIVMADDSKVSVSRQKKESVLARLTKI